MEQYNLQEETNVETPKDHLAPLMCITPLSKYLALALFIILPFLGGWIGYVNAPERVVEVEKTVEVEKQIILANECVLGNSAQDCVETYQWQGSHPDYTNSDYEIGYLKRLNNWGPGDGYTAHDNEMLLLKKNSDTKVKEVVIEDVYRLMSEQGLDGGMFAFPSPVLFIGPDLIFGGQNYEGHIGSFYKFDPKSQVFTTLPFELGNVGIFNDPIHEFTGKAIYIKDGQLLVLDLVNLESRSFDLQLDEEIETVYSDCAVSCFVSGGWSEYGKVVWYTVYEKGDAVSSGPVKEIRYITLDN